MQTNKRERKPVLRRPEVRSLIIQPKTRINRYSTTVASEIKLCGNWLTKLGFSHGSRVLITTKEKLLIITLLPE